MRLLLASPQPGEKSRERQSKLRLKRSYSTNRRVPEWRMTDYRIRLLLMNNHHQGEEYPSTVQQIRQPLSPLWTVLCSTDWWVSLQAELEVSPCTTALAEHCHRDTWGCPDPLGSVPAVQKGHAQGHSAAPAKLGKNSNLSSQLGHVLANQSDLSAKPSLSRCLISHYFRGLMSSLWGQHPN